MRSHLPDPIIIHLEKRSLGLSETQIIPGKGQEKPLQNIEPDLVHHLTFQARYWKNPYVFLKEKKSNLYYWGKKADRIFCMIPLSYENVILKLPCLVFPYLLQWFWIKFSLFH